VYRVQSLLQKAIRLLTEAGCDTPRLDAEVIFAHTLEQDRSWLYAHNNDTLPDTISQQLIQLIQRRVRREPVAYIIGQREFFGLTFKVTPDVLIPRPETELLVEQAIQLTQKTRPLIVDVGTGSGCIAISLAVQMAGALVIATDVSSKALVVAQRNARRHSVETRIHFKHSDLLSGLEGPVDLLVSNPPYISATEMNTLAPEVALYEPSAALTDASTGLSIIEKLLGGVSAIIGQDGLLLVEFGANQGQQVLQLAQTICPQACFEIKPDLAGLDRLLIGRF